MPILIILKAGGVVKNSEKGFYVNTLKNGILKGIEITWQLARIVVPIYFLVTFLQHTPVIDNISSFFAPLMSFLGLPGKTAIVLVLGCLVNLYAAVGAIVSLSLTIREITILAIMLSFCHSLPVETAVSKKIGLPVTVVIGIRVMLAVVSGFVFNLLL